MHIGKSGRDELQDWAWERAREVDAFYPKVVYARMGQLKPRWGGSTAEMGRYMLGLRSAPPTRPLAVLGIAEGLLDTRKSMPKDEQESPAAIRTLEMAVDASADQEALSELGHAVYFSGKDHVRGAAYLLQKMRFGDLSGWESVLISGQVLEADPEWALGLAAEGRKQSPEDGYAHLVAGHAYRMLGHHEAARRHHEAGLSDAQDAKENLGQLAGAWRYYTEADWSNGGVKHATRWMDAFIRQYPDEPYGWGMAVLFVATIDRTVDLGRARRFVALSDGKPQWAVENATMRQQIAPHAKLPDSARPEWRDLPPPAAGSAGASR